MLHLRRDDNQQIVQVPLTRLAREDRQHALQWARQAETAGEELPAADDAGGRKVAGLNLRGRLNIPVVRGQAGHKIPYFASADDPMITLPVVSPPPT